MFYSLYLLLEESTRKIVLKTLFKFRQKYCHRKTSTLFKSNYFGFFTVHDWPSAEYGKYNSIQEATSINKDELTFWFQKNNNWFVASIVIIEWDQSFSVLNVAVLDVVVQFRPNVIVWFNGAAPFLLHLSAVYLIFKVQNVSLYVCTMCILFENEAQLTYSCFSTAQKGQESILSWASKELKILSIPKSLSGRSKRLRADRVTAIIAAAEAGMNVDLP